MTRSLPSASHSDLTTPAGHAKLHREALCSPSPESQTAPPCRRTRSAAAQCRLGPAWKPSGERCPRGSSRACRFVARSSTCSIEQVGPRCCRPWGSPHPPVAHAADGHTARPSTSGEPAGRALSPPAWPLQAVAGLLQVVAGCCRLQQLSPSAWPLQAVAGWPPPARLRQAQPVTACLSTCSVFQPCVPCVTVDVRASADCFQAHDQEDRDRQPQREREREREREERSERERDQRRPS